MNIILASASPRRKQIMENAGFSFIVFKAEIDEEITENLQLNELVIDLALKKALEAKKHFGNGIIIGADTLVEIDGKVLGKPVNEQEAREMLNLLSGKTHSVYTGLAVIYKDKTITDFVKTKVVFRKLSEAEIDWYIETGEPFDKAGGYGIQEKGSLLVKEIEGDYFNVVGLPIARLNEILKSIR